MRIEKDALERWQSIASIASSIAIPLILAIVGYLVQRQLANEGLKKDYVSIATGILKEDPTKQEDDLRRWAVTILESNSPIPFTSKARDSLLKGPWAVVATPRPTPTEACMTPPKPRGVLDAHKAMAEKVRKIRESKGNPNDAMLALLQFSDAVVKEETAALETASHLTCMQEFAKALVERDLQFRVKWGLDQLGPMMKGTEDDKKKTGQSTAAAK